MLKLSELPSFCVGLGMMQHGTDTVLPLGGFAILTRGVDILVNRCNSRAKKMAVTSLHFVARPVDKVIIGIATGAFSLLLLSSICGNTAFKMADKITKDDASFKRNCIHICFIAGGIGVGAVGGAVIGGAIGSALIADAVLGIVFPYPLAKAMRRAWIQGKYAEDVSKYKKNGIFHSTVQDGWLKNLVKSEEKKFYRKMAEIFDYNPKKPNKDSKFKIDARIAEFSENKLRAFVEKNPKYDCPFWSVLPKQTKANELVP